MFTVRQGRIVLILSPIIKKRNANFFALISLKTERAFEACSYLEVNASVLDMTFAPVQVRVQLEPC